MASENSCETSKRRILVSYSILGPLGISPIGFPSRTFWILSYPCRSLVSTPCSSWRRACLIRHFPIVCHCTGGVFAFCVCAWDVCAFPICCHVVSLSCVAENITSNFQIFFGGKWSICSGKFGVFVWGGEFKIFYAVILDCPSSADSLWYPYLLLSWFFPPSFMKVLSYYSECHLWGTDFSSCILHYSSQAHTTVLSPAEEVTAAW